MKTLTRIFLVITLICVLIPQNGVLANPELDTNEQCDPFRIDPDNGLYPYTAEGVSLDWDSTYYWHYASFPGQNGNLTKIASNVGTSTQAFTTVIVKAISEPADFTVTLSVGNQFYQIATLELDPNYGSYSLVFEVEPYVLAILDTSWQDILVTYSWVAKGSNSQVKVNFASLLRCYEPGDRYTVALPIIMKGQ